MKLADTVTGVQDGKYSPPPRVVRKQRRVKAGIEYWCVTDEIAESEELNASKEAKIKELCC